VIDVHDLEEPSRIQCAQLRSGMEQDVRIAAAAVRQPKPRHGGKILQDRG
jgi:hypothetical protein